MMADLLEQIRKGDLPAGTRLPSEADLVEKYGVSRGTVRRAVRELETAGHVEARHGVGRSSALLLELPIASEAVENATGQVGPRPC
ncbi:GntR family transcriptional regulator [Streptomyces mirabilis]|uniref:GntR family transcriptional regulator n=1 Tax=Streptomyces mirabilis TaxID=68239 RepID=UPI0039A4E72F